MEYSKLRMFFEIRYPSSGIEKQKENIISTFQDEYFLKNTLRDELHFKQKSEFPEVGEIKVGPKRFGFTMGLCPGYDYFTKILAAHLKKVASFLAFNEIIWMEARGHHLYPISSLEEFFELVTSLGAYASLEFSDNGVYLFFQEDNLKVNIIYRFMERALAKEYFLSADEASIPEMNLSMDIDVSLEETMSPKLLEENAKKHMKRASDLMKQKAVEVFKPRWNS